VIPRRRKAREVVLKVLYQVDLIGKSPLESFDQVFSEEFLRPILQSFASNFLGKSSSSSDNGNTEKNSWENFVEEVLAERKNPKFNEIMLSKLAPQFCSDTHSAETLSQKTLEKLESLKPLENFALELLSETTANLGRIDDILIRFADNWSLDRMPFLDRAILRFAVCELLYFKDIPINVTINEAIELAKKYSTEKSREFINGILDKIYKEFKPEKNDPRMKSSTEVPQ